MPSYRHLGYHDVSTPDKVIKENNEDLWFITVRSMGWKTDPEVKLTTTIGTEGAKDGHGCDLRIAVTEGEYER